MFCFATEVLMNVYMLAGSFPSACVVSVAFLMETMDGVRSLLFVGVFTVKFKKMMLTPVLYSFVKGLLRWPHCACLWEGQVDRVLFCVVEL